MNGPLCEIEPLESGIVRLWLNRPDRCNAFSTALLDELIATLEKLETDNSLRVVILRGRGKIFCGGLDLYQASTSDELAREMPEKVAHILSSIYESRLVFIASVHGAACAGGAALTTVCDLSVAVRSFKIALPEVRRGLSPALLLPLMRRKVAEGHLRQLMLTGMPVTAERAQAMGIITHVVDDLPELDDAALAMAQTVLEGCPASVAAAKKLIAESYPRPLADELADSLEEHLRSWHSPEAQEGIAAFLEKRQPRWD